METTIKTVLDVPVLQFDGRISLEDWPVEITCKCSPGEPRTHDYPGSPPEVEITEVRFRIGEEWFQLDDPATIEMMVFDVCELALKQLTCELLGRYDSEMESRLQRGRDGN